MDGSNPLWLGALQLHSFRMAMKHSSKAKKLQRYLEPMRRGPVSVIGLTGAEPVHLCTALSERERSRHGLSGRWRKDRTQSDSVDELVALAELPWILGKAVEALSVIELAETDEHFESVTRVGGIWGVVEKLPRNGAAVRLPRRDNKKGYSLGRVEHMSEGTVSMRLHWPDPVGGECVEVYKLSEDGRTLTQTTTVAIHKNGRRCTTRFVYHRIHS